MKAGVAVNPHTSVSQLEDIIADVDLVCLMSVNPGFGGQKFIENTYHKIQKLRAMSKDVNPGLLIEIDGGVGIHNIAALVKAGANVLVAGNAVFAAAEPKAMISDLKNMQIDTVTV